MGRSDDMSPGTHNPDKLTSISAWDKIVQSVYHLLPKVIKLSGDVTRKRTSNNVDVIGIHGDFWTDCVVPLIELEIRGFKKDRWPENSKWTYDGICSRTT